jgi:Flp pilus assembly protein TadD
MRVVSIFVPFPALCLLSSCLLCSAPLAAQQKTPPPVSNPNATSVSPRILSVNGMVSDASSHSRLDLVRVELRSMNGALVGTVFTTTNGTFHFENVVSGDYNVVADQAGYESFSQQVQVGDSPVYGLQVDLVKAADSDAVVSGGPGIVSARELSIPSKAHGDMEKGMALLYGKSDYHGSLKPFEKAIQEYPDYYEAYAQLGVAYMKLADTVNAEKAFRESIEVSHEKFADAYFGLGELFLNTKRFADAESASRKAVEIDPQSWRDHSQLARTLVELHRPAEAEPSAVAAVKLQPDNPTLYLVLANIHIQLQNNPALLDDLTHYLKLAPDGPFAEQARRERDEIQQALAASQSSPAAPFPPQP